MLDHTKWYITHYKTLQAFTMLTAKVIDAQAIAHCMRTKHKQNMKILIKTKQKLLNSAWWSTVDINCEKLVSPAAVNSVTLCVNTKSICEYKSRIIRWECDQFWGVMRENCGDVGESMESYKAHLYTVSSYPFRWGRRFVCRHLERKSLSGHGSFFALLDLPEWLSSGITITWIAFAELFMT